MILKFSSWILHGVPRGTLTGTLSCLLGGTLADGQPAGQLAAEAKVSREPQRKQRHVTSALLLHNKTHHC